MTSTTVQSPNGVLLTLVAMGFVLGLIFMRSTPKAAVRHHDTNRQFWVKTFLSISLGLGILVGLGFTFSATFVAPRPANDAGDPQSDNLASPFDTGAVGATTNHSQLSELWAHRPETWSQVENKLMPPSARLGIVLIVGLIVLIGLGAWMKPSASSLPAGNSVDRRSGLGWIVVPAGCLSALGILAAPTFYPPLTSAEITRDPAIPPSVQEKMNKAVRDLLENVSQTGPDAANIPSWIKSPPTGGATYLLSSGQFSTRQEAEDELLPLAAKLLQRAFHEHRPWQGSWKVPLQQIRERVVSNQFFELRKVTSGTNTFEMCRVHMLVNVSPEITETFTTAWKSQIVERRLRVLGMFLAWLSCVLLVGQRYFWSLTIPGHNRRWLSFLKATIITVAITAAAGWGLTTFAS